MNMSKVLRRQKRYKRINRKGGLPNFFVRSVVRKDGVEKKATETLDRTKKTETM